MRETCLIEALEGRRFFSVTAASLLTLTKGATWTDETLSGGKVIATSNFKVIGSATFNGHKCTRVQSTSKTSNGTSTVNDYSAFDKAGNAISWGTVTSGTSGGHAFSTTIKYSTGSVGFPAVLPPKVSKSFSWTSSSTIVSGSSTTTSSAKFTYTFRLPSAKLQTVKVPAGTFKAYVVNETIKEVASGQTINQTVQAWFVPGKGAVKIITSAGTTVELTKYKA